MRRNKRTREEKGHYREESKRSGCLKWFGIGFVVLMLMSSLGGGESTENKDTTSTQNFATTTTDNERVSDSEKLKEEKSKLEEGLSSEIEESIQAEESLDEQREANKKRKEEEERLAKEKEEEERLAREKEEEERREQESIEAAEKWQEKLDNPRTDVTYDNLMRTPDEYFGEVIQYSGTVLQTINSDNTVQQRVALYDDYDKIVLIEYYKDLPEVRLLDDDYITFTGMSFGTITYETVLGAKLEIPSIFVERINLE